MKHKYEVGDKIIYITHEGEFHGEVINQPKYDPEYSRAYYYNQDFDYRIAFLDKGYKTLMVYANECYLYKEDEPRYLLEMIRILQRKVYELEKPKGLLARIFG